MKKSKSNAVFYLFGSGNGQPEEFCSGRSLLVFCAALFLLVVFTAQETVSMLCVLLGFGVLLTALAQGIWKDFGRLFILPSHCTDCWTREKRWTECSGGRFHCGSGILVSEH